MTEAAAAQTTQTTQGATSQSQEAASAGTQAAGAQGAAATGSEAAASATSTTERPAYVPEQFWDAEKGSLKADEFGSHFAELTAFKASEDSRRAAVPETADKYELKLPADAGDLGEKFKLDPADPMLDLGREIAHELGADQATFEKIVAKYASRQVAAAQAAAEQTVAAEKAQNEALGPKADERRAAIKTFVAAKYGPEFAEVISHFLPIAAAVTGLERMMRDVSGGTPTFTQTGRAAPDKGISDEDWGKMTPKERLMESMKRDQRRA